MKNYELIRSILKEQNISTWLIYSDEHSDPVYEKYICNNTIVASCCIVTQQNIYIIVHELDYDNVIENSVIKIKYGTEKKLIDTVLEVLGNELMFPDEICLSYSTLNDTQTDILGFGLYQYLTNRITDYYSKMDKSVNYKSAENIIYSLFDRKVPLTIERMTIAANRALDILEEAFKNINGGMSELDIVKLTHEIFEEKRFNEKIDNVISETYAWAEDLCPIVLVGPSLKKGGHALASNQLLSKGLTIYFDFGVTLTFADGEKVSSDIQRMGYFLNDNETCPPAEVQKVFDTLVESIDMGIEFIKPGLKGYEVDARVRNYILAKGYPDYNHSTGHSIGEEAHNPGTLLGAKESKLANLDVQKYGVYSIEPRISIVNGGSIEETVYVTENGGVSLSKRQKQLYIVK